MSFDLVITNGRVFGTGLPAPDGAVVDVAVSGETIAAVGLGLAQSAGRVVDASGKVVMLGGVDVHVHLELPFRGTTSSDDWDTGTRAATRGGVTPVIDFAIPQGAESLAEAFEDWSCDRLSSFHPPGFGGQPVGSGPDDPRSQHLRRELRPGLPDRDPLRRGLRRTRPGSTGDRHRPAPKVRLRRRLDPTGPPPVLRAEAEHRADRGRGRFGAESSIAWPNATASGSSGTSSLGKLCSIKSGRRASDSLGLSRKRSVAEVRSGPFPGRSLSSRPTR